jgi:hypothetical protein
MPSAGDGRARMVVRKRTRVARWFIDAVQLRQSTLPARLAGDLLARQKHVSSIKGTSALSRR